MLLSRGTRFFHNFVFCVFWLYTLEFHNFSLVRVLFRWENYRIIFFIHFIYVFNDSVSKSLTFLNRLTVFSERRISTKTLSLLTPGRKTTMVAATRTDRDLWWGTWVGRAEATSPSECCVRLFTLSAMLSEFDSGSRTTTARRRWRTTWARWPAWSETCATWPATWATRSPTRTRLSGASTSRWRHHWPAWRVACWGFILITFSGAIECGSRARGQQARHQAAQRLRSMLTSQFVCASPADTSRANRRERNIPRYLLCRTLDVHFPDAAWAA